MVFYKQSVILFRCLNREQEVHSFQEEVSLIYFNFILLYSSPFLTQTATFSPQLEKITTFLHWSFVDKAKANFFLYQLSIKINYKDYLTLKKKLTVIIHFIENEKAKTATRVVKMSGEKIIVHNPLPGSATKVKEKHLILLLQMEI